MLHLTEQQDILTKINRNTELFIVSQMGLIGVSTKYFIPTLKNQYFSQQPIELFSKQIIQDSNTQRNEITLYLFYVIIMELKLEVNNKNSRTYTNTW